MSNTYEINEFQEVVPYSSGTKCNDTRAWRDATELELQQQEDIKELEARVESLESELDQLKSEEIC